MKVHFRMVIAVLAILVFRGSTAIADNPFPLGKKWVPKEWLKEMPKPFGISFVYTHLQETLSISNFDVTINGNPTPPGFVRFEKVKHSTNNETVRFDAWILPFLNVYGLGGWLNGTAKDVELVLPQGFPPANVSEVDYDGHLYGTGLTAAYGHGMFFGSYDVNFTWTNVNRLDNTVHTITQAVRAGVHTDLSKVKAQFYTGAFREGIRGTQRGVYDLNGMLLDFGLEARALKPWNALVGSRLEFTPHWVFSLEGGFSGRKQISTTFGYRF